VSKVDQTATLHSLNHQCEVGRDMKACNAPSAAMVFFAFFFFFCGGAEESGASGGSEEEDSFADLAVGASFRLPGPLSGIMSSGLSASRMLVIDVKDMRDAV
jgi:hypothetical protein